MMSPSESKIKNSQNDAGFKEYLRTLVGALLTGLFWLVMGLFFHSLEFGFFLLFLSLLLIPVLFVPAFWYYLRLRKKILPVDLRQETHLGSEIFHLILNKPGPKLKLWVLQQSDAALLLFSWPTARWSHLLLTRAWLEQAPSEQSEQLKIVWSELSTKTFRRRVLESVQLFLWIGALFPAEIALFILAQFLRIFPLKNFPSPAFVFQRFAWSYRSFWFQLEASDLKEADLRFPSFPSQSPRLWESVIWGSCFRYAPRALHPLWLFWTHKSLLLKEEV